MTTKEVMFDSVEECKAVLSSRARSSRKISTCAAAAAWWTESPYWGILSLGIHKN